MIFLNKLWFIFQISSKDIPNLILDSIFLILRTQSPLDGWFYWALKNFEMSELWSCWRLYFRKLIVIIYTWKGLEDDQSLKKFNLTFTSCVQKLPQTLFLDCLYDPYISFTNIIISLYSTLHAWPKQQAQIYLTNLQSIFFKSLYHVHYASYCAWWFFHFLWNI